MKKILQHSFIFILMFPLFAFSQTTKIAGIELIFIKADVKVAYAGANDNGIKDESDILSSYYIGKYEITNEQFARFLNYNKSKNVRSGKYSGRRIIKENKRFGLFYKDEKWQYREKYKNNPVVGVSWYGANAYCEWLSLISGKEFSLPTKNQWIYAASDGQRSSSNLKYSGTTDNNIRPYANYIKNTYNKPKTVGSKLPNKFGIYDMSGNVKEWCYSYEWSETKLVWVDDDTDPMSSNTFTSRHQEEKTFHHKSAMLRGGGWADMKKTCRISTSPQYKMVYRGKDAGFRVCMKP